MKARHPEFAFLLIFGLIASSGCGKSDEQRALDAVSKRKKASMVRLVNMTESTLDATRNSQVLATAVGQGTGTNFIGCKPGEQKLSLKMAGKTHDFTLNALEGQTHTVLVTGSSASPKFATVSGEIRVASGPDTGVEMYQVQGESASKMSAKDIKFVGTVGATVEGHTALLPTGRAKLMLPGFSKPVEISLEQGRLYSLYLNGTKMAVVPNSDAKPQKQRASGAG
jgi:hypothetical protein